MITADGRSTVEMEIEQMQFTGLDTRKPVFGLDYADIPLPEDESDRSSQAAPSFFARLFDRLFGLNQTAV